jgi:isochorismate synthase
MPQEKAKQFILKNEPYNREFYTGYLGEINNQKKSWLFVNLRCMQIYYQNFKIYVGGGITKDSKAEKEWEETELKSRTLLSVIEKM